MPNVDQFESVFKAAAKDVFVYEPVAVGAALIVTDLSQGQANDYAAKVRRFLSVLGEDTDWTVTAGEQTETVDQLLGLIESGQPNLIVTYRNLHAPIWPSTLGRHLDVLTQATPVPVLVMPHPGEAEHARAFEDTNVVMAMTDHLAGDARLVNYAVRFTSPGGTLVLSHVEDDATFDRYMATIEKIPEIDTDTARETIREQLLKDPHDYVVSCSRVLSERGLSLNTVEVVTMGHHLTEYRQLVDKHKVDLLVINTKDEDQLAMHGLAYPLAVELRGTPMLML